MTWGGKRQGAGAKLKFGEPSRVVRVPESQAEKVVNFFKHVREGLPQLNPNDISELFEVSMQNRFSGELYLNSVQAGYPSPGNDYYEGKLDLNDHLIRNPAATFFVRVSGDSMINAGIYPDDILVVDRSQKPKDGKIVIAVIDGELTVKRLRKHDGRVTLLPENKNYDPIEVSPESSFKIWGVVTSVIHEV